MAWRLRTYENDQGNMIQVLKHENGPIRQDQITGRDEYLSVDRAREILDEHFYFEEGLRYEVKVLMADKWRQTRMFDYNEGIDVRTKIWGHEHEGAEYSAQGLDYENLHVYAIRVDQI